MLHNLKGTQPARPAHTMPSPKIYPDDSFFVIPGKPGAPPPLPIWKQQELSSDPNFRDLGEQVKEAALKGKGTAAAAPWSAKHGYKLSFKEEAAILKENTRKANAEEAEAAAAATAVASKKSKQTPVKQKFVCIVM